MPDFRSPLLSRRGAIALAAASVSLPMLASVAFRPGNAHASASASSVTAKDGTKLFVQESGRGSPVVFIHGWSLNSDIWREQFAALTGAGMRCVGYDRRGHGRSGRARGGYDYDTLSDDLASVLDQ